MSRLDGVFSGSTMSSGEVVARAVAHVFTLVGLVSVTYYVIDLGTFFSEGFLDDFDPEGPSTGIELVSLFLVLGTALFAVLVAGVMCWLVFTATRQTGSTKPSELFTVVATGGSFLVFGGLLALIAVVRAHGGWTTSLPADGVEAALVVGVACCGVAVAAMIVAIRTRTLRERSL